MYTHSDLTVFFSFLCSLFCMLFYFHLKNSFYHLFCCLIFICKNIYFVFSFWNSFTELTSVLVSSLRMSTGITELTSVMVNSLRMSAGIDGLIWKDSCWKYCYCYFSNVSFSSLEIFGVSYKEFIRILKLIFWPYWSPFL